MIDTRDSIDKALQQGDSIDQALQQGDSIEQALQGETQVAPEPVQEEQLELPQEDAPTENQSVEQPQEAQEPQEVQEPQEQGEEEEDENTVKDYVGDIAMALPRGIEAAVEGIYNLGDTISEQFFDDGLPDWDIKKNNVTGTSKTGVGRFGVGLIQFATGLIPGFGALSLLGKVSKATRLTSALSKGKGVLKSYSANKLSLSPETMKKLSRLKPGTKKNIEFATAGTISEFLVFKGQQERLSNMLATHEGGGGPVQDIINWMAYDPNDENHNEFIERGKTALEGLIVGEIIGLSAMGLFKGYRKYNPKREGNVTSPEILDPEGNPLPPEAGKAISGIKKVFGAHAEQSALVKRQIDNGETPDPVAAADAALKNPKNVLTQEEKNAMNEMNHRFSDAEDAERAKNITGVDPETAPRPEGVQEAQDNIKDAPVPEVKQIDPETAPETEIDDLLREHGIQTATLSPKSKRAYAADILEQSKEGGTEQLISKVEQHVVKVVKDAGLYDTTNPQALLSGIRVLNSVTEMRAFLGHVAKVSLNASKQGKMSPEAREKFLEETRKITIAGMEGAGGKPELDLTPFRDRVEDLQFVRSEAEVLYDAMNNIGKDLEDKVTNAAAALENKTVQANVKGKPTVLNEEEAMTEVFSAMDRWAALQEIWADFGTQLSLGLRQRNDLYRTGQSSLGRDIAGQHRTLGVALEDAMKRQGQVFRRENRGVVSDKRIIKDLQRLFKKSGKTGTEGMEQMVKDFNQVGVNKGLSQWTLAGRKGLAVSQEWYYNAILGSPTSWAVNFVGGALVLPLRHIESIAGGVMTGNVDLVKANFRVMFDLQSFADSVKFMWKSGGDDEARSVVGYTAYRDDRMFSPKGEIRVDNPDGTLLRESVNWVGKAIRFPSRIMMMGDEFFKQMSYRARIKTSLAMSGYKKGLHREPGALAKHIDEGFNSTITENGRFRNEQNVQREALEALSAARKKGEDITNERDFVNTYVKDHYSNNNLKKVDGVVYGDSIGFEERQALVEAGTDWALVNTFTNKVDNAFFKATGDMAQMSPWLGFVIPFVKTPSNILLFALGRTLPRVDKIGKEVMSGLSKNRAIKDIDVESYAKDFVEKSDLDDMPEARKMVQSYLDTIQSGNSIQSAEAMGRLSTGIMSMGTLFMYIETLGDRITGSAPEDPGKREAWEATGKKAFSIKWGDKWYSYQRLDPFATTLGIMADISQGYTDTRDTGVSEFGDEDEFEEKQEGFMRFGAIMATAMANNVSNKSYIENLGELLDMLEKPSEALPNIGGNIMAGFVPNGLNWSQNVYEESPALLEARGMLDKIRKRIPESMRPGEKLMPRRNAFGKIMTKGKSNTGSFGKAINPFFSSETSNDIVNMEIEHQAVGRRRMGHSRSIGGNTVDYRDYRNENGDTAYDRMQHLSGTMKLGPAQLNLHQALRRQIQSNDYQYLPPVTEQNRHKDHPRTKALTKTINKYRAHARRQTEQEFKELRADLANLLR